MACIGQRKASNNAMMLHTCLSLAVQEQEAAAEAEDTVQRLAAKKAELETQIGVREREIRRERERKRERE